MTSLTSASVGELYWSESTPIPRFPVALAALNTPAPEPPAAAKMMSMPSLYMPVAIVSPCCGALKPEKSGGSVMYFAVTVALGLDALTPASKPAWKVWISGTLTPPMKPTLLVVGLQPGRDADQVRALLGGEGQRGDVRRHRRATSSSTMAKCTSGLAPATSFSGPA